MHLITFLDLLRPLWPPNLDPFWVLSVIFMLKTLYLPWRVQRQNEHGLRSSDPAFASQTPAPNPGRGEKQKCVRLRQTVARWLVAGSRCWDQPPWLRAADRNGVNTPAWAPARQMMKNCPLICKLFSLGFFLVRKLPANSSKIYICNTRTFGRYQALTSNVSLCLKENSISQFN